MAKPNKNGRRGVQVRDQVIEILRNHPDGLTVPEIQELITLKHSPQGKSLGQLLTKTAGIKITGKERIGRMSGEGKTEYSVYSLIDEQAYLNWRGG